jgi:predicted porin
MNKSSLLALAIAGTIAAPAVMAGGGYVSARLGVDMKTSDDDAKENTTFGNISSRLGWKGETDLGNGMTAFGKVEVGDLSTESANGFSLRDLHVGLAGDFGKIIVGERVYGAYYNHVSGPVDAPYTAGSIGLVESGRTDQAITYQGGNDMFSFEVTAEADGTDTTDTSGRSTGITGVQVGGSIGLGDNWTIAAAFRDAEDSGLQPTNGSVSGVTVYGSLGDISLAGSFQSDDDDDGITATVGFGSFWVEFSQIDKGVADVTPTRVAIGGEWALGENTSFWAEAQSTDSDGGDDSGRVAAALKFGF